MRPPAAAEYQRQAAAAPPAAVVARIDDVAALLAGILRYVADVRIVNEGPLSAPSQRFEVQTFVGGEFLRTYGATPGEALRNFAQMVVARLGRAGRAG